MISPTVKFEPSKYADVMKKVELLANEKEIANAISRGAKKAADEAKKETVKQLLGKYTLPDSEIKPAIKTRKMGGSEAGAVMHISSGVFPLYKFGGVTPREVMPPAKGPVRAQVKSDGGADLARSFVAKMPGGHIGVYEREGTKRYNKDSHGRQLKAGQKKAGEEHDHINEHFGPAIAGMFGREKETEINIAARKKAMETLDKYIIHELERLMYG